MNTCAAPRCAFQLAAQNKATFSYHDDGGRSRFRYARLTRIVAKQFQDTPARSSSLSLQRAQLAADDGGQRCTCRLYCLRRKFHE